MNDSSPLPVHDCDVARWPRRYQRVDVVLEQHADDEVDSDPRPAALLSQRDPTEGSDTLVLDQDLPGYEDGPEEFLRLWTSSEGDRTHETAHLSPLFSMRALQGAVIANGAALVALALLMTAPDGGSRAGLMASAMVLGLGLMCAAISVVVTSLDFRGAQLRIAKVATSSRLATISGAVSYAALALAAFPLFLITR